MWKEKEVEVFFEKYKRFVFYIAMQKIGSEMDAEDISQQVFLKAVRNFSKINSLDDEEQKAYLSAMTSNAVYDFRKKSYPLPHEIIEQQADLVDSTYEFIRDREIAEIVWQCVEKLEEKHSLYGKCIALRYYMGFKDSEIADTLNISHVNCRAILHRARKKLRDILINQETKEAFHFEKYKK